MSRWLPQQLCVHVLVVNIFIRCFSNMRALSVLRPFNIRYFHNVLNRLSSRLPRSSPFNIIDHHLVPDKLIRFWLYILKWLEIVSGIQWVLRRVASVRLELIHTGRTAFDVCVGQVELWLVQLKVEHPWTSSLHVESVVKVWSVHCLSSPYFRLGP